MSPLRPILVLLCLGLLPASTCSRTYRLPASVQRTLTPAVELPPTLRRIDVQFHDGLLIVEDAPEPSCKLEIHLLGDDQEAVDALAEAVAPAVQVDPDGRRAALGVALPTGASLDAVRTTWRLFVPAGVEVRAETRTGAVIARDLRGDLDVRGGSGVVEVQMAGGSARLATGSGSLILRGDFPYAELQSQLGRVDVSLPVSRPAPIELHVQSGRGDCYLDVCPEQVYDLFYLGDQRLVQCDPEVRVQWEQNVQLEGLDYLQGRVGDMHGNSSGMVRLESQGLVRVRLRPEASLLRAAAGARGD